MTLRFPRHVAVLITGWLLATLAASAQPWPHEQGDIPPDPAIRWGRLENGLRYAVRRNAVPAGRVYLIMQVAAGSVNERDDQSGYAHFVEHMMFRGTKKYPATSIVNFLQHEGLAMGADTSAFTNYNTTFYNLDLPHNTPEKIGLGLSILRDFSDGALIAKAEVKREAKVVASERRTRDTSASRVGDAITAYLYPDSLVTRRSPIGTVESVEAATAEGLQEFYRTWYRPSRLTIRSTRATRPSIATSPPPPCQAPRASTTSPSECSSTGTKRSSRTWPPATTSSSYAIVTPSGSWSAICGGWSRSKVNLLTKDKRDSLLVPA